LLEDGAGRLHRRSSQDRGFEVVTEGGCIVVFTARFRVELENEGDEKRKDEEGKQQGDAVLVGRMLKKAASVVLASRRGST